MAPQDDPTNNDMGPKLVAVLAGFYIVLAALSVYVLVSIWPQGTNSTSTPAPIHLFIWSFVLPDEIRLLWLVIASGALGGFISGSWIFSDWGGQNLVRSSLLWYIFQPFLGLTLALVVYFLARGGLLTGSINLTSINAYGVSGLAALVGMFSSQATEKLKEIFDTMFAAKNGKDTESKQPCVKCGADLPPKSKFCNNCGAQQP